MSATVEEPCSLRVKDPLQTSQIAIITHTTLASQGVQMRNIALYTFVF